MYLRIMDDRIKQDLALDVQWVKGKTARVRDCWHFSTDGNAVDNIFMDDEDFQDGMNRIYVVRQGYPVDILAFVLMGNHVHFVLHGGLDSCKLFMHEYIRRTSMAISRKYSEKHKLISVPINYQEIDDDRYLKSAICYTIKNPTTAGLPYNPADYPWSSGSLYFRQKGLWTSPVWMQDDPARIRQIEKKEKRLILKTDSIQAGSVRMVGGLIHPEEYVSTLLVQKIFRSCRAYNYFMWSTKDSDVESKGGSASALSIPDHEMRQNKAAVCRELFNVESVRSLDTQQRLRLARALKSRYCSSTKQLARICGLVYNEVKGLI